MRGILRSFRVEGLNLERFLRQAADMGLSVSSIKRKGRMLTACAMEENLPHLQNIAEQGGWRFITGARRGWGRSLDKLRAHKLLAAGVILVLTLLMLSMQFVWHIDVSGADLYAADTKAYLAQHGIRPLMLKRSIDLSLLRDALEWRYPNIAWADCGWRGGTLRIQLIEGTPVGDTISHQGSGNIVAARDGIVESVITLAGTDVVKPGDVVHKGQVLIQGVERTAGDTNIPVMARGQVYARVWESATARIPMHAAETHYTGQQTVDWTITGPWFDWWHVQDSVYETEDVRRSETPLAGLFLPLRYVVETHMEAELFQTRRNEDEVQAEANAAALRLLAEKAGKRDDLVDKWVDCCMIEDEEIEAIATGEWIMDIAQPVRYEP